MDPFGAFLCILPAAIALEVSGIAVMWAKYREFGLILLPLALSWLIVAVLWISKKLGP